jgi:hypothetical protein
MVKISGTLSSGVSLSGRLSGGQGDPFQQRGKPIEKVEKPVSFEQKQPDMTFSGIGRKVDILV